MKIMISQPMRGKTDKQIRDERKALTEALEREGHEVVDTVFESVPNNVDIAILFASTCFIEKPYLLTFSKKFSPSSKNKISI